MSSEKAADEEDEAPVHGDVLEAILSRVPLIDLASSSCVSRGWERAVSSSLSHFNTIKPWLITHAQAKTHPFPTATYAYDPRSDVWMEINQSSVDHFAALRSSHSTLLYMLSPSKLSISIDPLHLMWHHLEPPMVWRTDPIVAMVGHRVIIAAGTCGFIDGPLAVEIYDLNSKAWTTCDDLPRIFTDYATSTWFSTAVDGEKLYVMQKNSGVTFSFDPISMSWCGPYNLNPDPNIFSSVIGSVNGRLVLVGLLGTPEDVKSVKIWEVEAEASLSTEMGEMPRLLVEKLQGESGEMSSIAMTSTGDFIFLHHGSDPVEVIKCEVEVINGDEGCRCQWGILPNAVVDDRMRMRRLVFSSSNVGIGDLQRAMRSEDRRIWVKDSYQTN